MPALHIERVDCEDNTIRIEIVVTGNSEGHDTIGALGALSAAIINLRQDIQTMSQTMRVAGGQQGQPAEPDTPLGGMVE